MNYLSKSRFCVTLLFIVIAMLALTGAKAGKDSKAKKPMAKLHISGSAKDAGIKCDELFSKVVVSGHVNVQINLNQGYGCSVEPPELAKKLDIKVKEGTIFVEPASEWGTWFNTEQVQVTLTTMDVDEINLRGSGDVVLTDKIGGNLTALVRGTGDLLIKKGRVEELKIGINGDGDFYGDNLEVQRAEIRTFGSGNFSLGKVAGSMRLELSGSGKGTVTQIAATKALALLKGSSNLTLSGATRSLKARLFGSSKLDAKALSTQVADILIKGSGSAEIRATKKLEVDVFGSGNLTYFGEPEQIKKNVNGTGWVEQAK